MKNIYTIYTESVLTDIETNISNADKDLENMYHVPTVNDFKKNPYNGRMCAVAWNVENIIEPYRKKYSKLLGDRYKDWNYIQVLIEKDFNKKYAINVWLCEHSELVCRKVRLMGWETVTSYNIKQCKEWVIKLIQHLADNPDELDELFKHSDKIKNEVGPNCPNKDLNALM